VEHHAVRTRARSASRPTTRAVASHLGSLLPALVLPLLAASCAWFAFTPPEPPPAFAGRAADLCIEPPRPPRFFAFGDFGTGGAGQRRVAAGLAARARAKPPDFMVLLGDHFYPDGVDSAADPQWLTKFEQPYADPALQVPCYAVLGNHDHRGRPQAQLDYAATHPRFILPAPWYAFAVRLPGGRHADFFALDTTQLLDETAVCEAQLTWLSAAICESEARWQIVIGHHPVHSGADRGLAGYRARLEPVLRGCGVDLGLFGHDHFSQWLLPKDGLHVAIAGGGGGRDNETEPKPTPFAPFSASGGGFADVVLEDERIVVEFADADGATLRRFEVTGGDR
jgi:acid phosphatase